MNELKSVLRPAIREAKSLVDRQRKLPIELLEKDALRQILLLHEAILAITWDEKHERCPSS